MGSRRCVWWLSISRATLPTKRARRIGDIAGFVPRSAALPGAEEQPAAQATPAVTPSRSAANLVPSTRFLIFWKATSLA